MVPALTRLLWPRPAAEALAKVKAANVSASFRDLFLPGGRPPLPGLLSRRLDLAAVLDAVADQGISAFYGGNLTREMAAAVRKRCRRRLPPYAQSHATPRVQLLEMKE